MKTKAQLEYSLKWLEVDLKKKSNTPTQIANIKKKIKDINEKIAKKGGRTRRSTRRN
jgi:hypothetical protein